MWLLLSMVCCCLFGLGSAWTQPASCHVRQSTCSSGLEQSLGRMEETLQVIATSLSRIADTLNQDPNEPTTSIPPTSMPPTTTIPLTTMPPIVLGSYENPAVSCNQISQDRPSGEYWIQRNDINHPIQVYCDTSSRNCSCNTTGGWARVANLDMTDPNQTCPDGFRKIASPKRTCGRPGNGCYSTTYSANGVSYSQVCGRIKAYQYHSPDAFWPYFLDRTLTIDDGYVNGVSLTHSRNPRQHIWTFANAFDEVHSDQWVCPCTKTDTPFTGIVPPFIGEDYFCDTGSRFHGQNLFYSQDPLWDGAGCGGTSTCCQFNNPPWFCKQLSQPTTDDIELRLCAEEPIYNEDIAIEQVELFVQ